MATIRVDGVRDDRKQAPELGRGLPPGAVHVKGSALVQSSRAGGPRVTLDGLEPDDVVEIEMQDGMRLWSRVDQLSDDLGLRGARGDNGAIHVPGQLTIGPASRSMGGWAIKALKAIGLDIPGEIAQFAATHVEGKLLPGPGLYQCSDSSADALTPVGTLSGTGPVLVFLHGTASSASGSFAGLWMPMSGGLIKPIFKHYGARVLAFQHRSLTLSPVENALELTLALAAVAGESDVHLVSHSRGGLIGELLTRGPRSGGAGITDIDLGLFEGDARVRERQALEQLKKALADSRFRIARFVRVACPARGTTLADRRLDRYLSVLVNVAGMVPGLNQNPVYDGLTSLLAGVLKKRTEPEELPGLEAMMPTSPLVRMLNRPDIRTDSELHVLGGDLAGAGLLGRLKTLATDFYYRDDHDLVVNTPAMLGGSARSLPIKYWIDTGDKVTHFNYFARPDTAGRLQSALLGSSAEFRTLEVLPSQVTKDSYVKRAELKVNRPVVFVLPGIMGSQLAVANRPVWMSILELARGGFAHLASANEAEATGLLADGYEALCKHLTETHIVMPFPYDWRRSIEVSAEILRKALDEIEPLAAQAGQPIRLLAHSMGGLVVRAMLATAAGRDTWNRICRHPGSRFIMLGTPSNGSHAIPAMLMGRDGLVKKLALVDLRSDHNGLLGTITGFDGVLNLLPHGNGGMDFFDQAAWKRLLDADAPESRGLFGSSVASSKSAGFRWSVPSQPALDKARAMAENVRGTKLDATRVVYVAGSADETACDVVIDSAAREGRRVRVMATARGDGRVLWETGIPEGLQAYYMDTVHGDMASDRRHFRAIVDLLNDGSTTRLPQTPPLRRGVDEQFEMREPMPAMIPDEAELVSEALGGRRGRIEAVAPPLRIKLRMVHDNLTNARFPVLASHYKNDVIVAAEAYLDARLGGRLSELHRMEIYPGPINSGVVVLNDPPKGNLSIHPGAIIAGLGDVGELTPGRLTSTLANALTLYGADVVGNERRRRQREQDESGDTALISAPVTAILVGSGEGGVSFPDGLRSLLRAVLQANQRLRGRAADGGGTRSLSACIDQLEIFELYEDRAIEALHTLRGLAESSEFADYIVEPYLESGDEGVRRVRYEQAAGWWQRIRITGNADGSLSFEAVTQAARAPARLRPTQRGLVDGFVDQAVASTAADPKLGQTLFEMLVPNDFKAYAPDRRKLALMLNVEAASLPWELMHDGFDRGAEPLAVSSGMIRQLLVPNERAQVLRAPSNTALVIGNPRVADRRFPPLRGAAEEAAQVAGLLKDSSGWDVQLLIDEAAEPLAVLSAIHDRAWRVLHLAAHGVFEFDTGKEVITGLVLDDGLFFTAAEADQMRHVPELVFINCCHLGQARGDAREQVAFHRLAANLATQFIKMGARAVVAAGWEVDDAAAKTFAGTFYKRMLAGDLFGDAILQARKETHMFHGGTNTWGAYQCYGDVSFSLGTSERSSRPSSFVSPAELCVWLEGLTARARGAAHAAELLQDLESAVADTPADWWRSSEVCARAAEAFLELGYFERAAGYFESVPQTERANASIRALELSANCKVRWAGQLVRIDRKDPKAVELLDQAETLLDPLLDLGRTSERLSLLGGYYKRRALMAGAAAARRQALTAMSKAYADSYAHAVATAGDTAYPLGNQLAADVVLSWKKKGAPKEAARGVFAALEELDGIARSLAASSTDAFHLSATAERGLVQALAERKMDNAARGRIARAYQDALSRGATAKKRDSMRTQFHFFISMIGDEFPDRGRSQVLEQMKWLEQKLFAQDAPDAGA